MLSLFLFLSGVLVGFDLSVFPAGGLSHTSDGPEALFLWKNEAPRSQLEFGVGDIMPGKIQDAQFSLDFGSKINNFLI